jgi:penicillin-binding protein 1A
MLYSSIARGGVRVGPVFVSRVLDRKGGKLAAAGERVTIGGEERVMPGGTGERVMDAASAYVTIDMMRNVFTNGTAKKGIREGMDFAGKTGTTSNFVDAWFVGYSPRYTVAVWVGTDGQSSIGDKETGGKTALPTWSTVMEALPNVPGERFPVPEAVVLLPADKGWLGYDRARPPDEVLVLPPPSEDPLPPFGFSFPAARAETAEALPSAPAPRLVLPAEPPPGDGLEDGAGDPSTQPPAEDLELTPDESPTDTPPPATPARGPR